jgi:hypothetical protein
VNPLQFRGSLGQILPRKPPTHENVDFPDQGVETLEIGGNARFDPAGHIAVTLGGGLVSLRRHLEDHGRLGIALKMHPK